MNVIVIFDLEDTVSQEVRQGVYSGLHALSYVPSWINPQENNKVYNLPKNALFKMNSTLEAAKNEVINYITVIKGLKLVRCIIVPSAPWIGIPGESYTLT